MLARRRSSRLDEARQAVEQQVEDAFQQSLRADSSDTALLRRKSFGYLPPNLPPTDDNLRVAKQVIQDVYSLQERYDRQHAIENVACAVAMTGVSLVILDNEYFEDLDSKLVLRVANSALTSILLGLICWRFVVERNILIRRNVLPPNAAVIGMPKQLLQLVIELSICAIFVPPGTSGSFTVREWKFYIDTETNSASNGQKTSCGAPFIVDKGNCYLEYSYPFEVLGLLSLLRLYMIPRVIRNLSSVASYHTAYLGTLHRVDTMSPLFAIKCFLQSNPFRLLVCAFMSTLVLTSYALAIVEAPVNPNLAPLTNSVWLVALTMATVGYGDIVPVTTAGQVLLVFGGMIAGILLIAALSAALFAFLHLDERDKRFIHSVRRQKHERDLKHACARTIQVAWRRFHDAEPESRRYQKLCDSIYKRTSIQRELRKKSIGEYISVATELQDYSESWIRSLRQEQTATLSRLEDVESRMISLIRRATTAVSKAS